MTIAVAVAAAIPDQLTTLSSRWFHCRTVCVVPGVCFRCRKAHWDTGRPPTPPSHPSPPASQSHCVANCPWPVCAS